MIMNYIVVRLVINQRKIGIHTSCYSVLKIERLFNQTPTISIHLGQEFSLQDVFWILGHSAKQ